MKIAVRLDDITPDMDWERFLTFKSLLDRYHIKPLIGVVPQNEDEHLKGNTEKAPKDFWEYIKELQKEGWVVAMHGFRHIYATDRGGMFPLNNFSEFAGIPYEQQKSMLSQGREILLSKGIDTDMFMAPAHSYDSNTLRALTEAGFHRMTDGFGNRPYLYQDLIFYPISFRLGSTLKKKNGYSTMVIHAGTVLPDEIGRYEKLFEKHDVEWISYQEYLQVSPVKRTLPGRYREFLMAKGKFLLRNILS